MNIIGFFGQQWPFHFVRNDFAIGCKLEPFYRTFFCSFYRKLDYTIAFTESVSDSQYPASVTIILCEWNQQVTNVVQEIFIQTLNTLVGTPEAVCLFATVLNVSVFQFGNKKLSVEDKEKRFSQWLAGFIDGDGCFLVSKRGYTSLEITRSSKDEEMLHKIKNKYGGSVKARAGMKALRYRQHNKEGMMKLCNDVNGSIRHPVRLRQFGKVTRKLSIQQKSPDNLSYKHGWFAGMFDADGTVILKKNGQVTISVTQKYKEIPLLFKETFNIGYLYFDKSQNGYWSWAVSSENDVMQIIEYFKHFPVQSSRRQKQFLIPQIYRLKKQKAHKKHVDLQSAKADVRYAICTGMPDAIRVAETSVFDKSWAEMLKKWNSFSN